MRWVILQQHHTHITSMQINELTQAIERARAAKINDLTNLDKIQKQVEDMQLTIPPDVSVQIVISNWVDFNECNRQQLNTIRSQFPPGTRWNRSVDCTAINYTVHIDGIMWRFWHTELPPSCKLVKKLVEVPAVAAHFEEKYVVECKQTEQEKDEDHDE